MVMTKCIYCNTPLSNTKNTYCNNNCQKDFQYEDYIQKWKYNVIDGQRGRFQISNHIRRYLFLKYGCKCSICHWGELNPFTEKSPLEIDHIDGNPYNNIEQNLRLICPNCHSLTATYKALNKGNGRKGR